MLINPIAPCTGNGSRVGVVERSGDPINDTGSDGQTLLCAIIEYGYLDLAKQCIEMGADINKQNARGFTPLYQAALGGSNETARVLPESKADVEGTGEANLLYAAVVSDSVEIIDHWSLSKACEHGRQSALRALVKRGLDNDIRSEGGLSPLHIATMRVNPEAVEILLDAGADPNAKDGFGDTPLQQLLVQCGLDSAFVKVHKDDIVSICKLLAQRTSIKNYDLHDVLSLLSD